MSDTAQRRRVLVVDDEPSIRDMVVDVLGVMLGCVVDVAETGELALSKVAQITYDVIVCDVQMGGLDGPGLYEALCHVAPELRARFVLMTGNAAAPRVSEFLERTGVPSIGKPAELDEIVRTVQRVLDS